MNVLLIGGGSRMAGGKGIWWHKAHGSCGYSSTGQRSAPPEEAGKSLHPGRIWNIPGRRAGCSACAPGVREAGGFQ